MTRIIRTRLESAITSSYSDIEMEIYNIAAKHWKLTITEKCQTSLVLAVVEAPCVHVRDDQIEMQIESGSSSGSRASLC